MDDRVGDYSHRSAFNVNLALGGTGMKRMTYQQSEARITAPRSQKRQKMSGGAIFD